VWERLRSLAAGCNGLATGISSMSDISKLSPFTMLVVAIKNSRWPAATRMACNGHRGEMHMALCSMTNASMQ
jgi:hypothetical protein